MFATNSLGVGLTETKRQSKIKRTNFLSFKSWDNYQTCKEKKGEAKKLDRI